MEENNVVTIEKMTYGIDSIAHLDGKVVFIPYGVPGDKVKIEMTPYDLTRGRITFRLK